MHAIHKLAAKEIANDPFHDMAAAAPRGFIRPQKNFLFPWPMLPLASAAPSPTSPMPKKLGFSWGPAIRSLRERSSPRRQR